MAIGNANAILEDRADAKYFNSLSRNSVSPLQNPPNRVGQLSPLFPETVQSFWEMNTGTVNQLLVHFQLEITGSLTVKKERLAAHYRVQHIINQ
jgi:hypothetical protein